MQLILTWKHQGAGVTVHAWKVEETRTQNVSLTESEDTGLKSPYS